MRVAVLAGVVIIVAAALVVPVPTTVRSASRLEPLATPDVVVQLEGRSATDLNGTYLRVAERRNPSLAQVLMAAARPDQTLRAPARLSDVVQEQPVNIAALLGLGLSPARMQGVAMPVDVTLDESVDSASLASALQTFDVTAPQDAAAGRTILGLGRVMPDQTLVCDPDVEDSVQAGLAQDVDLVIAPTGCEGARTGRRVIAVKTLSDAVTTLLESGER